MQTDFREAPRRTISLQTNTISTIYAFLEIHFDKNIPLRCPAHSSVIEHQYLSCGWFGTNQTDFLRWKRWVRLLILIGKWSVLRSKIFDVIRATMWDSACSLLSCLEWKKAKHLNGSWIFESDWNVLELKNQVSDNFETYGHIIMVTVLVKDYYDSFRIEYHQMNLIQSEIS